MAKKKAVKKAKKKTKKSVNRKVSKKRKTNKVMVKKRKKATNRTGPVIIDPETEIHRKINLILCENPTIECDLTGEEDEGRNYGFVSAASVFRMYNEAFKKHHLTIVPISITPTLGNNCVLVSAVYKLTDIETGYSIEIAGCGLGANGQWSANTAMTLALKQALLNTFLCSWPQPETLRQEVNRDAKKTFSAANSPQQIREVMGEFFEKFPLDKKKK